MKIQSPVCLLSVGVLLLARSMTAQPAARTIEIQVGDNMRFNPSTIEARAGERLRIVLKGVGTMPKLAMGHNLVLLKKGVNPKAFVEKPAGARDTGFVAPEMRDQLIAATMVVGPGESSDTTFVVPASGDYDFVCSFPGHFNLGMRGKLVVR